MTTKRQYRPPSEAEWEFACRGGSNTGYCWGNDATLGLEHAWFRTESPAGFHPVAQKKPNAFGLHDVHGNVGECTENAYTPDGYSWLSAPAQKGLIIWAWETIRWAKRVKTCVVRGGRSDDSLANLRSASR